MSAPTRAGRSLLFPSVAFRYTSIPPRASADANHQLLAAAARPSFPSSSSSGSARPPPRLDQLFSIRFVASAFVNCRNDASSARRRRQRHLQRQQCRHDLTSSAEGRTHQTHSDETKSAAAAAGMESLLALLDGALDAPDEVKGGPTSLPSTSPVEDTEGKANSIEEESVYARRVKAVAAATGESSSAPSEQCQVDALDLRLLLRPSPFDPHSDDWRDWLGGEEYVDVWAPSSLSSGGRVRAGSVEDLRHPFLDNSTRYLLSLLDDAAEGIRRGWDRVTTGRCNQAIELLSDTSIGGKKLTGRAQRADAILRRMERCEERLLSRTSKLTTYRSTELPHHELPLPDRRTYVNVLGLFAREAGPQELARCAEAIVDRMLEKYSAATAAGGGGNALRPNAREWNQVLSCWAVSTDPEKSVNAAALLRRMKEIDSGNVKRGDEYYASIVDSSSYGHALRACALSGADEESDKTGYSATRSRKLGAEVALRLWSDYKKSGLPMTSRAVTFVIRAVGGGLSPKDPRRERAVEDAFHQGLDKGLINAHVMQELGKTSQILSSSCSATDGRGRWLVQRLVGKETEEAMQRGVSGIALLRKLPSKWTVNATAKSRWGW